MKKHRPFEFVIDDTKEIISGDTIEEVFNSMPDTIISNGSTLKTKVTLTFSKFGIELAVTDTKDNTELLELLFSGLQSKFIGTWKWKSNKIGEMWRYDPTIVDLVRRVGKRYGVAKKYNAISGQNIRKSHEARRNNPHLGHEIGVRAGTASQAKQTPEQRRERILQMVEARRKKIASMTPEEYAEFRRIYSEAAKARCARQKQKQEALNKENNNEQI